MFGNGPGWVISAILLVAAGWFIFHMHELDQPSPPGEFGRNAGTYSAKLPMDPRSLLQMDGTKDGGSDYRAALDIYQKSPSAYDRLAKRGTGEPSETLLSEAKPGIDKLINATNCGTAHIFEGHEDLLIDAEGAKLELAAEQLTKLGTVLEIVGGHYATKGQNEQATRYLKAELTLGIHMYEERLTVEELRGGLGMIASACWMLRVADPDRKADYEKLYKENAKVTGGIEKISSYIKRLDKQDLKTGRAVEVENFTADMRAVATTEACDRVWRVQATLALGRMKYNAARYGDRGETMRVLRRLQKGSDPVLALAAKVAEEQTWPQLQNIVHNLD